VFYENANVWSLGPRRHLSAGTCTPDLPADRARGPARAYGRPIRHRPARWRADAARAAAEGGDRFSFRPAVGGSERHGVGAEGRRPLPDVLPGRKAVDPGGLV